MDKHTFFASLYASASDDGAHEAEVPSPPRLMRAVKELKQARAPDVRTLAKPGTSDSSLGKPARISDVKPLRTRTKPKQPSPKAPFYCMNDSTARRPKRRVQPSPCEHSSPNLSPPQFKPRTKSVPTVKPAMSDSSNTTRAKKRLPWDDAESKRKQSRPQKKTKGHAELPDHKKIFRGLFFYYFPNSDVSPARKFRITKAAERGAERIQKFGPGVTHIVVDSGRTYAQLLDHLKLSSLPSAIHVVNDYYAAECIEFGFLVDPSQRRFHIEGLALTLGTAPISDKVTVEPMVVTEEHPPGPLPMDEKEGDLPREPAQERHREEGESGIQRSCENVEAPETSSHTGPATIEEAIEDARRISQLPIEELSDSSDGVEPRSVQSSDVLPNGDPTFKSSVQSWQDNFQCMHANDSRQGLDNPNAQTVDILNQMIEYYERTEDQWRCISYRKAIAALRRAPKRIETKEEALAIRGIGERLALKVEEIAQTSRLRRLEHAQAEPEDEVLKLFTGIYGVGTKQARAWISQGHRTLEDLLAHASLSPTQRVGIAHHSDFGARIPRDEVTQHGVVVKTALAALDTRVRAVIGGSYRRGAATSGDVDFLIIGSDDMSRAELHHLIFDRLVPALFAADYLQCALASSSSSTSASEPQPTGSKWHGAARVPGIDGAPWRRVDLLLVPADEQGAAMLYFTGNDIFNRSMRLLARKRGMRLNQRGLWQRTDGKEREGGQPAGTLLHAREEQCIFELLGVPWREAWERNC